MGSEMCIRDRSDLVVNDMVSITFAGEIQETYSARIMNVIKVQLLGENLH